MHFTPEDEHHLRAAEGWLDLDQHMEANEELQRISPGNRAHPVVLFARCRVYLGLHRPDYTHTIATTLTNQLPERPEGWFYVACACSRLGQQEEARAALKRCFIQAEKAGEELQWQQKVLGCRDLDGWWVEEQGVTSRYFLLKVCATARLLNVCSGVSYLPERACGKAYGRTDSLAKSSAGYAMRTLRRHSTNKPVM